MIGKKVTVGVLVGVVAGVVSGILTAPKAGRENRLAVKKKAQELKEKVTANLNHQKK